METVEEWRLNVYFCPSRARWRRLVNRRWFSTAPFSAHFCRSTGSFPHHLPIKCLKYLFRFCAPPWKFVYHKYLRSLPRVFALIASDSLALSSVDMYSTQCKNSAIHFLLVHRQCCGRLAGCPATLKLLWNSTSKTGNNYLVMMLRWRPT